MNPGKILKTVETDSLQRGHILNIQPDGRLEIRASNGSPPSLLCDMLLGGAQAGTKPAIGDEVLMWAPKDGQTRGVVLGIIGPTPQAGRAPQEELLLEAIRCLRLKCGNGLIEITADGAIRIKGQDVTTHARRRNRVKGGSVAIN
jgi:hypothetical protein